MRVVIFETVDAVFQFHQPEVEKQIVRKKSAYEIDQTDKLLSMILAGNQKTIKIPEEPLFFNSIALDLICSGIGSVFCNACNKTYQAGHLIPIVIGSGRSPLGIKREKKGMFRRLFSKKHKPPELYGGIGHTCPAGHELLTVITWKTF